MTAGARAVVEVSVERARGITNAKSVRSWGYSSNWVGVRSEHSLQNARYALVR